jgi:hypothetical protein
MPSLAFRITGQYKPTNDAAVRASLRDAFAPGAIEDDVECPETHRIVAIRGAFNDTQTMVGNGAFAIRGRFSSRGDVGGCETNKALRMYLTETAQESVGGYRALVGRPTVVLAAMPSSVRNPARKRKAAKRRNPSKPPPIGTVWTARAKVYDGRDKYIGSCMDTPNAIAKMFMEVPAANMVVGLGGMKFRDEYTSRMYGNTAMSHFAAKPSHPAKRR